MFVDLTIDVSQDMSVHDATLLEKRIVKTLKEVRKEISEVRIKFNAVELDQPARNDPL
jgi:divalent metal cation (Fe/Co/Zn/Cd) transporter